MPRNPFRCPTCDWKGVNKRMPFLGLVADNELGAVRGDHRHARRVVVAAGLGRIGPGTWVAICRFTMGINAALADGRLSHLLFCDG